MRYRQEAEPTWLLVLPRRELRKVFLLHDLVSQPPRRCRGPAPDRSLAQALRVAVVLRQHEHPAHELRWRLETVRQLVAREVSLRQTLGGPAPHRQHEHAAHKLPRRLITARRPIAREVSLGQTLCNGAAQKRQERAMSELRGTLEPLLAGTWR
jgi:hypothetical protein